MNGGRLLLDAPLRGSLNMAVDELLLESARVPTLRWYRWATPTLSLGYFQSVTQRQEHGPSLECPLVRRATGGGAIVHDREWTYSVVLPRPRSDTGGAPWLYDLVHDCWIATLALYRVPLTRCSENDRRQPPFLCFQRRTAGDLLCHGEKVLGSAQRRRHGALLQHGSLLLARSDQAPELPGIRELTGIDLARAIDVVEEWSARVGRALGVRWEKEPLTEAERAAAEARERDRYGSATWNHRR